MNRKIKMKKYSYYEQLISIYKKGSVWDGDLISKSDRNDLVKDGLVKRTRDGFNVCTKEGAIKAFKFRHMFRIWTRYLQIKWRIEEVTGW